MLEKQEARAEGKKEMHSRAWVLSWVAAALSHADFIFLSDTCSQRVRVKKCLTFSLSWGRVLSIVLFSCTQIYLLLNTAHQKSICEAQYFSYTRVLLVFFCHWYLVSLETSMSSAIRMLWLKITHKLFPGVLFFFVCYYLYGQQCYFTGDNICFISLAS